MSALFFSDVHLRDGESEKTKIVLKFLRGASARYDRIYILGDFFDVWPGTNSYLINKFASVLDQLRALVKDGHTVFYVEGNHDFHLGKYFRDMGIKVIPNSFVEDFNGRRVYMAHGDLGNPREKGYPILRRMLRSAPLHAAMKIVPGKWIFDVGLKSSQMSRGYQKQVSEKENLIRSIYRQTAETLFHKGFDVVLMGHTHLPDDYRVAIGERNCRYINLGDWVRNFTYLEFDGLDFYTKSYPVKPV
jgi:UDP-2,3-diacylglucosamine hydrolase